MQLQRRKEGMQKAHVECVKEAGRVMCAFLLERGMKESWTTVGKTEE